MKVLRHSAEFSASKLAPSRLGSPLFCLMMGSILLVAGCSTPQVATQTLAERKAQAQKDVAAMFAEQPRLEGPVTLYQAMARAIIYNLDHRVKIMEGAVAQGMSDVSGYAMLPRLAANAGYQERDRTTLSSQDRFQDTYDLNTTWNVLDFGVSYIRARQRATGVLIATQLRLKMAQNLLQEVRSAFGRGVIAQDLQERLQPILKRVEIALASAREAEKRRLQEPMELLDFQKKLLSSLEQLQQLRRELSASRMKLAGLMNQRPGIAIALLPDGLNDQDLATLPADDVMEDYALVHRPELYERDYEKRVRVDETRQAILAMLPGLSFSKGQKYDNSGSYINHAWGESGMMLAWNLISLVSGPANIAKAEQDEALEEIKRLALNMSVLTQVHVARLGLWEAWEKFGTAQSLSEVNERLYQETRAGQKAASMTELELIRSDVERILFDTRRDIARAERREATGQLLVSLGVPLLPENYNQLTPVELADALAERHRQPPELMVGKLTPVEGEKPPEPQVVVDVVDEIKPQDDALPKENQPIPPSTDPAWVIEPPNSESWIIETPGHQPPSTEPSWIIETPGHQPPSTEPSWIIETPESHLQRYQPLSAALLEPTRKVPVKPVNTPLPKDSVMNSDQFDLIPHLVIGRVPSHSVLVPIMLTVQPMPDGRSVVVLSPSSSHFPDQATRQPTFSHPLAIDSTMPPVAGAAIALASSSMVAP